MLIVAYRNKQLFFARQYSEELLEHIDTPFLKVGALAEVYGVYQNQHFLYEVTAVLVSDKFHDGFFGQFVEMD